MPFRRRVQFDRAKRDQLAARETALATRLGEIDDEIHALKEGDGWNTDHTRQLHWNNALRERAEVREDLKLVRHDLGEQNLLDREGLHAIGHEGNDVYARFMESGKNGVTAEELGEIRPSQEDLAGLEGLGPLLSKGDLVCIDPVRAPRPEQIFMEQVASDVSDGGGDAGQAVQTDVYPTIFSRLLNFGGPARFMRRWTTADTRPRKFPQGDDLVVGERHGSQRDESTEADWELKSITTEPDRYSSKYCDVSGELLTDLAPLGIESYVGNLLIRRIGRKCDLDLTRGVATESIYDIPGTAGVVVVGAAAENNLDFTFDDIVDTPYAINRAYRQRDGEAGMGGFMPPGMGQIGWIFADGMEQRLMRLKDSDGRPIWLPMASGSLADTYPGTIHGKPYVVAGSAEAPAKNKPMALFGNFSHYGIRDCRRIILLRFFDSGTANAFATRFLAFSWRWQGPLTQKYGNLYEWLTRLTAGNK